MTIAMNHAVPVTEYVYCARCGIDLPRPPAELVGEVLPCPCCDAQIRIARAAHLWCEPVSRIALSADEALMLVPALMHANRRAGIR